MFSCSCQWSEEVLLLLRSFKTIRHGGKSEAGDASINKSGF